MPARLPSRARFSLTTRRQGGIETLCCIGPRRRALTTAMSVGFVVILFVSLAFLGPGLFSDRTDYPLVTWLRGKLASSKATKSPPPSLKGGDSP